jgi:DNA transformation protein and related proteins
VKNRPIEKLRNIGHVTAYDLKEVGVADEKTLREIGAIAAYQRLKELRPRHYTVVGLWALAGALNDCPWNQLPPDIKKKLDADLLKSNGSSAGTRPKTKKPAKKASAR